jgi:hypothetical protein
MYSILYNNSNSRKSWIMITEGREVERQRMGEETEGERQRRVRDEEKENDRQTGRQGGRDISGKIERGERLR